jgi:hypothetical protein
VNRDTDNRSDVRYHRDKEMLGMTSDPVRRIQIDQLLAEFRQGYAPFVMAVLKTTHGTEWYGVLRNTPEVRLPADSQQAQLDATALVRVILAHWDSTFSRVLTPNERSLLFELRTIRNRWAHQAPLSADDVDRLADNIARLLTAIRASNVDRVVALRDEMRMQRYQTTHQATVHPAPKLSGLIMISGASLLIAILVIGLYLWEHVPDTALAAPTVTIPAATVRLKSGSVVHTASATPLPVASAPATTPALTDTINGTPTAVVIVQVVQITAALTETPVPSFPCQDGQVKANPKTMIYHVPTGAFYAMTRNSAVICFNTPAEAEQAGYRVSKR